MSDTSSYICLDMFGLYEGGLHNLGNPSVLSKCMKDTLGCFDLLGNVPGPSASYTV